MPEKPVSLRDIARRLGISAKTVSGALNDSGIRMSEETRQRVIKLAEELGYRPNTIARGMRTGVMPIVGLLAHGVATQPFATEILRQFDNRLRVHDLAVVVTTVRGGDSTVTGLEELKRLMPQKIVYASMFHQAIKLDLGLRHEVSVMLNCFDTERQVPSLVPDEEEAAYRATTLLRDRGRKRIAYFNLPGLIAGTLREQGFRRALHDAGLPVDERWIRPATKGRVYSDRARSFVQQTVSEWFEEKQAPDAIVCGNDRVALEVYFALNRLGRRIPDDVAVISFDNQVDIAARLDPPLTTMALPHREIAKLAAEIVIGTRQGQPGIAKIPFRLVERLSV